jgi:hypothetical protein
MPTEETRRAVLDYYDCWKRGGAIDRERLRALLAADLDFESPVGGRSGAESFLEGVGRFATTLKELRMLSTHIAESEAAVLYDCTLTAPTPLLRLAEFFRVEHGKITSIRLVFDATEYRRPAEPRGVAARTSFE